MRIAFGRALAFSLILIVGSVFAGEQATLHWPGTSPKELPATDAKSQIVLEAGAGSWFYVDFPSNTSAFNLTTDGGGPHAVFIRQGIPPAASSLQELEDASDFHASSGGGPIEVVVDQSSSPKASAGRWFFAIVNTGSTQLTLDVNVGLNTSGNPFSIGPGISGTWYEPQRTGQGFYLEVLEGNVVVAVWFTYTPDGDLAYIIGAGVASQDSVLLEGAYRTQGGRFGQAFDSSQVENIAWGSIRITFDSCGHGYASALPNDADWPIDQLEISRLTTILGTSCSANGAALASEKSGYLEGGISGSWYDPSRSGEGFLVELLTPDLGVAHWFTYTPQGKQFWVGGVGQVIDGTLYLKDSAYTSGPTFGPDYDAAALQYSTWGDIALTFTGCHTGVMASAGPASWGAFSNPSLRRLTSIGGLDSCAFSEEPATLFASFLPQPGVTLDGDMNNPDMPNVDNEAAEDAQSLSNPGLASGYLTAEATGAQGDRFADDADLIDVYRATMVAGQTLQLVIADWDEASPSDSDLDLEIYSVSNTQAPVATSYGTGQTEFIQIPATGDYFIVASAYEGRSNYTLSLSSAQQGAAVSTLRLEDDAEPDEILVKLKAPEKAGNEKLAVVAETLSQDIGLELRPGEGRYRVLSVGDGLDSAIKKRLGISGRWDDGLHSDFLLGANQKIAANRIAVIKALRKQGLVEFAEPNYHFYLQAVPNDPYYPNQHSLPQINMPQAWDISTGDPSTLVAVVDSGVNPHPDLFSNVRYDLGKDFVSDPLVACDGDGVDDVPYDTSERCNLLTVPTFHGTHVAGTIAAITNNASGIAGIAGNVSLMPVRVLDVNGSVTTSEQVSNGLDWVISGAEGRSDTPAVMNLSLGAPGVCPPSAQEVFDRARARKMITIAAAGNKNSWSTFFPASCAGVVSVAAVDRHNNLAFYSNCGADIDIAAPGGETVTPQAGSDLYPPQNSTACRTSPSGSASYADGILSTVGAAGYHSPSYKSMSGTSMAAPHVSGVAALMKSVYPALTPQQFDSLLESGAITTDLGNDGPSTRNDAFGYGLVDAYKAVVEAQKLAGGGSEPPVVTASPTSLSFGDTSTQLQFSLEKHGNGANNVTGVSDDASWLSVSGSGFGTYTATVNRSGLANAPYSATISVNTSASGTLKVPVSMRVGTENMSGQSGLLYALLIDAITLQTVAGTTSQTAGGGQSAELEALPGNYYLVVGSDYDHDNYICDPGEACAIYPGGSGQAQQLDLRQDTTLPGFVVPPDTNGVGQAAANPNARTQPQGYRRR